MAAEVLSCGGLRVGCGGRPILPPIEMLVRPGELWAVIAVNGRGKTTLLRTVSD